MKKIRFVLIALLIAGFCWAPMVRAQEMAVSPSAVMVPAQIRILDLTVGVVENERHVTGMFAEITHMDLPEANPAVPPSPKVEAAIKYLQRNAKEIFMKVETPADQVEILDSIQKLPKEKWQGNVKARVNINVMVFERHFAFPGHGPDYSIFPVVTDLQITLNIPVLNPNAPETGSTERDERVSSMHHGHDHGDMVTRKCGWCRGTGFAGGLSCNVCGGDGYVTVPTWARPCARCQGTGSCALSKCTGCGGTGWAD